MYDFKLNNGLRVVGESVDGLQSVTMLITVDVGSRFESQENNGISHLVEHLVVRRVSNKFKSHTWLENYLSDGFNGCTSGLKTEFNLTFATEDIEDALAIFSSILDELSVENEDFKAEKEVVVEEIIGAGPDEENYQKSERALYGDHPLAFPVFGSKKSVLGIKKTQAEKFHAKHYCPENCILTVVGDISENSIKKQVEDAFDRDKGVYTENKPTQFSGLEDKLHFLQHKSDQNYFGLSRSVGVLKPDSYIKWKFFIEILGKYLSYEMRDKGFVYTLDCRIFVYKDYSDFSIEAYFDPRKSLKFYLTLEKKLRDFLPHFSESDLNFLTKNRVKELQIYSSYPESRSNNLSWFTFIFGKPLNIEEEMSIVQSLTLKEVESYFTQAFKQNKGTVVITGKIDTNLKKEITAVWDSWRV